MLPKAESAATGRAPCAPPCPRARVLALIESARGVANVPQRGRAPTASRAWSSARSTSRSTSTWTSPTVADGLAHAASRIAIASRVAGLPAPVAGVTPQLDDEPRLLADLRVVARAMASAPSCASTRARSRRSTPRSRRARRRLDWARRVLAAEAASPGAAQLDGRMIDRPVVLQAQRTLQRAGA